MYVTEKKMEIHYIIYVALFYAKYKRELSGVKHSMLENLDKIFKGQRVGGYPNLEEIRDRAEVYDIQL